MSPRPSPHGWFIAGLLNLAAYLSLIVLVAGFLTKTAVWMITGGAVGLVGMVYAFVVLGRSWSRSASLTSGLCVIAIDIVALVLMWTTT